MPELSVIIPVYNTEKYLVQCIESVLNQTYKNYEIILVDDASTDNSSKICDDYAKKYDFISVIHKEHGGSLNTRKEGLRAATGEFISYVDSDDLIDPSMYEYLMHKINKYNADIAICNIVIESENSRLPLYLEYKEGFYDKEKLQKEVYPCMLFSGISNMPGIHPSLCDKIIRKSILENIIFRVNDDIHYGEDGICTYPSLLLANGIYITYDKFFYRYRKNSSSVSHTYDETLLEKLPVLISHYDDAFSLLGFDGKKQLDCYAAEQLLYIIRKELLYNKNLTISKKIKKLKIYISKPRIQQIFKTIKKSDIGKFVKYKIFLLRNNFIFTLYLLFYFKEKILLLKGKKHGKNY